MTLTKKQRQSVWDKSGGICWYCGTYMDNNWHVDHIVPQARANHYRDVKGFDLNDIDNLAPACPQCNLLKSSMTLEGFRSNLEQQLNKCDRYCTYYRHAKRYGLIEETPHPIIFWFEKEENDASQ